MFLANQLTQWRSQLDNEDDRRLLTDPEHSEKGHSLLKTPAAASAGKSFRCERKMKGCLSGKMTEEESKRLARYHCIACEDYFLCESCAKRYADGKTLPDIICLKRPRNEYLWGLKYDESNSKQHVIYLNNSNWNYYWSPQKN